MKKLIAAAATALIALAGIETASASCAADSTLPKVRQAYANGQAHERAGKTAEALRSYLAAQAYICDPNPVEADAAKRAAALSLPLATAAEKQGDVERAFSLYESGGHYAHADRLMLRMLRAQPESTSAYDRAKEHFQQHGDGSFAENYKVRIAAVGGYTLDPKTHQEMLGWPVKACERVLQREAQTFSEDFLRDTVKLFKARPEDQTDGTALQALQAEAAGFHGKWTEDRVKASQELLRKAFDWTVRVTDEAVSGQLLARVRATAARRATTLVQQYFSAPALLDAAIDYYSQHDQRAQIDGVKTRAAQLGADSEKRGALRAASDYYEVAGDDRKAKALQARADEESRARMQPTIDAMQRSAAEMQKQYSDPARIEAMKKQAEEMRRALQKQQAQGGKGAADLEKELGM